MVYFSPEQLESLINTLPDDAKVSYRRYKRAMDVMTKEADPQVGQTPKEVIWTKNKAKLYRYQPQIKKNNRVPILLIYALINKPYILDLTPGNSLIEYLTNLGHDVYLLDWGTPGYEDRHMKFDHYIFDYIPKAVKKVLKTSNASEISLLGYCMGGTMTTIFAALHPELPIRNIALLTTPIDFSDAGLYTNWLDERYFNVDKLVDTLGLIPPEMIDFGSKLLNPIGNFYGPYISLVDRADNEKFITSWKLMQKWLSDGIPVTGEAYRQWIGELYQQNKLINDDLYIRGQRVELRKITANLLNIAGKKDVIVNPRQAEPLNAKVSSENKVFHIVDTGHVSVVTGSKAINEIHPMIEKWLTQNSS